jgi:hypothetical protein
MKGYYIKKLNMVRVLLSYLERENEIWNDFAPFAEAVADVNVLKTNIEEEAQAQSEITQGVTNDKETKKLAMVDLAIKLSAGAKAYASKVKNVELKTNLSISHSRLLKKKDQECYSFCKNIHTLISPLTVNLASYGITAGDLIALNNAIGSFHDVISAPQTARTESKNATSQLDVLFDQLDTVLKDSLDPLALVLKATNEEFYRGYLNARYIGGLGGKKKGKDGEENK